MLSLPLPRDKLYFRDADGLNKDAVSQQVYDTHDLIILSQPKFLEYSETLRKIDDGLSSRDKWHETSYNAVTLRAEGFVVRHTSTICAVDDGQGRAFIIGIYTVGVKPKHMLPLANYTIGHNSTRLVKNVRGQSEVNVRGSKTQSGVMNMYGSWSCYGKNSAPGANTSPHPAVYMPNPKHPSDARLNTMVSSWASEMSHMESCMTPASARLRTDIANKADPLEMHRMSKDCPAFSLSSACNYVVGPHDDSGEANEFIIFQNRTGPLPQGHEWLFTIPGILFHLPNKLHDAVCIAIPGNGVRHGTLPTSSTQPSYSHGNIGSALVTKKPIVKACLEQQDRGENTLEDSGPGYVASILYHVKTLAELTSKLQSATPSRKISTNVQHLSTTFAATPIYEPAKHKNSCANSVFTQPSAAHTVGKRKSVNTGNARPGKFWCPPWGWRNKPPLSDIDTCLIFLGLPLDGDEETRKLRLKDAVAPAAAPAAAPPAAPSASSALGVGATVVSAAQVPLSASLPAQNIATVVKTRQPGDRKMRRFSSYSGLQ